MRGIEHQPPRVTVKLSEFMQYKDGKPRKFWHDQPGHMIEVKATKKALRKYFPEETAQSFKDGDVSIQIGDLEDQEQVPAIEESTPLAVAAPANSKPIDAKADIEAIWGPPPGKEPTPDAAPEPRETVSSADPGLITPGFDNTTFKARLTEYGIDIQHANKLIADEHEGLTVSGYIESKGGDLDPVEFADYIKRLHWANVQFNPEEPHDSEWLDREWLAFLEVDTGDLGDVTRGREQGVSLMGGKSIGELVEEKGSYEAALAHLKQQHEIDANHQFPMPDAVAAEKEE